jgi:GINS complex subunit 2
MASAGGGGGGGGTGSGGVGDDPEVSARPLCWSAAELEFLAEDEIVEVKPTFAQADGVPLLGGTIPPFQPPLPARVPLWMAIQMKKQRRCELVAPSWLSLASLDRWLEAESTEERFGTPPCQGFVEVARVLLTYARDDLGPQADLIEVRLRDIKDRRDAKMQAGLKLMNDDIGSFIKVSGGTGATSEENQDRGAREHQTADVLSFGWTLTKFDSLSACFVLAVFSVPLSLSLP